MKENINLSFFQGVFNKIEYRKFILLVIIVQLLVFIGWAKWWISDELMLTYNVLLWFVVYVISVKRYRDIWEKKPFLVALWIFVPIVMYVVIYELSTKESIGTIKTKSDIKDLPKKKMSLIVKIFCIVTILAVLWMLISL